MSDRTLEELADAYLALWTRNLQAWAAERDLDPARLLEVYAGALKAAFHEKPDRHGTKDE